MGLSFNKILVLACLIQLIVPAMAMAGERYVLSNGGSISFYEVHDGKLIRQDPIVLGLGWAGPTYPVLRKSTQSIFFAASRVEDRGGWIYEAPLESNAQDKAKRVVEGRNPALSPNGKKLAYTKTRIHVDEDRHFIEDSKLFVLDLETGVSRLLVQDIDTYAPPVWLDDNRLLYSLNISLDEDNPQNDLVLLDTKTGQREILPFSGLKPAVKIPGRDEVLCGDYFGLSISLLDLKTRSIRELLRNKVFKVGTLPVLRPNEHGFLFTQQNWKTLFWMFTEMRSLYVRNWAGDEEIVQDLFPLSGGFPLEK
ncbi:MAG: hypothetical protein HQL35_05705 [Alphaproteobacteria bacterium]|nr:hypothetical protein [Alphaproteobacteria bacterium]